MLSSVLTSERAIEVNVAIMRAFVKLRELMLTQKDLARKIADLERKFVYHDEQFTVVFTAIRELMRPEHPKQRQIGFQVRRPRKK